jgi:hypothetical protein
MITLQGPPLLADIFPELDLYGLHFISGLYQRYINRISVTQYDLNIIDILFERLSRGDELTTKIVCFFGERRYLARFCPSLEVTTSFNFIQNILRGYLYARQYPNLDTRTQPNTVEDYFINAINQLLSGSRHNWLSAFLRFSLDKIRLHRNHWAHTGTPEILGNLGQLTYYDWTNNYEQIYGNLIPPLDEDKLDIFFQYCLLVYFTVFAKRLFGTDIV